MSSSFSQNLYDEINQVGVQRYDSVKNSDTCKITEVWSF